MRRIYTGIDIGSFGIKIIVSEVVNNKFYVLANTDTRSKGIKNGLIVDMDQAVLSLKKAKQEVEDKLGITINQAIVTVPSDGINFDIVSSNIDIDEAKIIDKEEITKVLQEAIIGHIDSNRELITIMPIGFQINDGDIIKDPKGLMGQKLSVKAVITTIPKYFLKQTVSLLKSCDIDPIDTGFCSLGDYYEIRNKEIDKDVIATINIGYDTTEVSIFNKGIMIKDEKIEIGSRQVDQEIAKKFNLKKGTSRYLKEKLAVSNTRYADYNDVVEVANKSGEIISINQLEISEIVETKILEILKLAKKQISILTNREISYIIITGGISELAGFQYVVENVFDRRASTLNIGTMGVRSNVYSSALGLIKYFHYKLDLRGDSYSMLNEKQIENLTSTKRKMTDSSNDSIIGKVFGYFSGE